MTAGYSEASVVRAIERLTARRLRAFIEAGCIVPAEIEGERVFGQADLARLELLCELSEDFGLDEDGLALVMSLIDQLHGLRHEMRALLRAVEEEPPEVRERIRAGHARLREG